MLIYLLERREIPCRDNEPPTVALPALRKTVTWDTIDFKNPQLNTRMESGENCQ